MPPEPVDPFEPRMPEVDVRPNMAEFFAKVRTEVANASAAQGLAPNQHRIGIVTPGRMVLFVPAPRPGTVAAEHVALAKRLIPSDKPLNIAAIGYTQIEPLNEDQAKCLPFLGQLLGLAYVGHRIVVFEGHPSAFEPALQASDVLLIDSGMLPFLQKDWAEVAWRVMAPGSRILVHDRKTRVLRPVVRSKNAPGWRYGEPDGEASYINCLLTTLAKRTPLAIEVIAGQPVPDLATLTADPLQLAWIAELPFRYEALSAEKVIAIALKLGKWTKGSDGVTTGILQTKLAIGGQLQPVTFHMRLAKDTAGSYRLHVQKGD